MLVNSSDTSVSFELPDSTLKEPIAAKPTRGVIPPHSQQLVREKFSKMYILGYIVFGAGFPVIRVLFPVHTQTTIICAVARMLNIWGHFDALTDAFSYSSLPPFKIILLYPKLPVW